jgi:hypothetical protein
LKKLRAKGVNYSWKTIREILSTQVRVTTSFKTEDKNTIHIRTTTSPTIKQAEIFGGLGIIEKPLKNVKVKIPIKKARGIEHR